MTQSAPSAAHECVFCAIATGQAQASVVHEDETVMAFMDLSPVTPGHLLVVPRKHATGLEDLDPATGARLWSVAHAMSRALRRSTVRCEGINLLVCDGEVAFQTVFHLHLHVIPRFAGDGWTLIPETAERERSLLDGDARAIADAIAVMARTEAPHTEAAGHRSADTGDGRQPHRRGSPAVVTWPWDRDSGCVRRREGLGSLRQLTGDVEAADWVVAGVRDFDHTIGSLVPSVFEAYARVLHPAARGDVEVSWAQVAAANGRQAHASMEWVGVTGSWAFLHGEVQPEVWDTEPDEGTLSSAQTEALATVLAGFTDAADECFYAVWDGFGAMALDDTGTARVQMPQRPMLLATGSLWQAARVSMETSPWEQSPSLWWPADRAWCVATDVDLMSTYVGASRACIDAVLAASGLEVWEVSDSQRVSFDSDTLNPVPPPPV